MGDRRLLWGVVCVAAFAFALRLEPLLWSPLPFSPDGIKYAGLVRDTLAGGEFPVSRMGTDEFGFTAFLAVASTLVGESSLRVGQPASAALGASTVLVAGVLAARLGRRLDLSRSRMRAAVLLAAFLVAAEGIYLFRSMATDEQTAGFLLTPAAVVAVGRWLVTGRREWGIAALAVAVVIPPLHNLSGLVLALGVVVLATLAVRRDFRPATTRRALAAVVLTCTYVFGFHVALSTVSGARVVQADRLLRVTDLFLAWVVLGLAGAAWYVTMSARARLGTVVALSVAGFGLVALNAVRPVFPETTATPESLLVGLVPLFVPAVLAGLATDSLTDDAHVGGTTVALLVAPLVVVATGLTARLTFDYLAMVFRAQLFLHLPALALAAVGAVSLGRRAADGERRAWVRPLAVALVLGSVAASAPVAYAGLGTLNYDPLTTESLFAATGYASDRFDTWATDDHGVRLTLYHGGNASERPVYRWTRGGPPPDCPALARRSWTTVGAQFYPRPPTAVPSERYGEWRAGNDVIYATTGPTEVVLVVPPDYAGSGCRR
jgi:hypothetical protein